MSQCTFSARCQRYSPSKIRNLFCSDATSNPVGSVLIIDANQTFVQCWTKHLLANVVADAPAVCAYHLVPAFGLRCRPAARIAPALRGRLIRIDGAGKPDHTLRRMPIHPISGRTIPSYAELASQISCGSNCKNARGRRATGRKPPASGDNGQPRYPTRPRSCIFPSLIFGTCSWRSRAANEAGTHQ